MDELDINGAAKIEADLEQEETKDTTAASKKKKKGGKKAKGAAGAQQEESKGGPATRTRGRLAAFLAQQKQGQAMKKMRIGVVFDEVMMLHRQHGDHHPERPERIMAIYLNLVKKGLFDGLVRIGSEEAVDEDLVLAHKPLHIKHVREDAEGLKPKENRMTSQVDTYMNMHTKHAALISAGSTVEAVASVCS